MTDRTIQVPLALGPQQAATQAAQISMVGEGPPVLMLHGFLGDRTCWQPLVDGVSDQYCCVSLDLLGFGASGQPQIRYDVPTEVAFVEAVRSHLGLEQLYLVGHSFGGWVAAAYAIAHPERVRGLLLAAPAGIRDDEFCGRYDYLRPLLTGGPWIDWGLRLAGLVAPCLARPRPSTPCAGSARRSSASPPPGPFYWIASAPKTPSTPWKPKSTGSRPPPPS
ncbi:MAG: alpha/beta fold hydrolase [Alkalinema sp. RU_4_3]|nr:alpha/beta fold hydrolase [Alkalinema sp. RU_4_3]